ncbi:haloperoxidase [Phytohabitans flavus]|uniref:Haloperoxidase n=1 Tax=Phytohabitans flavus TaxID=1076124 RepID=A0A6F8XSG8_9ACTN|nr:vanadium-dependent haloperoxidase [Phytohabitans flavus]BCB76691.1 haloperoxidase [Phytohabitans flavus]
MAWNRTLLRILRTPGLQPATVHATRSFALLHTAVYNAVVAAHGVGRPYLFAVNGARGAAPQAAAAQAAHDVLAALYPSVAADLDQQLAADLAAIPDRQAREAGTRIGAWTARLLIGLRAGDGSAATPPALSPGTEPGQYRPTPPGFGAAVFTHWSAVTPWLLDRASRFRSKAYPALTSAGYANAAEEVRRLGQDTSTTRTDDQTVQARFWAAPIHNYWNEIAQSAATTRHSGLLASARLFAELNLTFADAVIAFYDAKYHHRIWRPVTAIRLADTDGNPDTVADPTWNPLAGTPNDPAYPGAHSVVAQAGADVLARTFGGGQRISVTSESLAGVTRTFNSFQDAADEAGISRIFAGVHTRLDHDAGQRLGHDIARYALHNLTDPPTPAA